MPKTQARRRRPGAAPLPSPARPAAATGPETTVPPAAGAPPSRLGLLGLLALLAVPLPLVGCGGDDGSSPPPDQVPPAAVGDLRAVAAADGEVTLAWTAPGDDGAAGTAAAYDLRRTSWDQRDLAWEAWTPVPGLPAPAPGGGAETFTVTGLATGVWLFRLATRDEALWSDPGNVAVATASPELDTTPPAAPADLVLWSSDRAWLEVAFTAVTEDGPYGGPASAYEVRWATAPVTEQTWEEATPVTPPPPPAEPGERIIARIPDLDPDVTYHVAARAVDERGNPSPPSTSLAAATVRFRTWYVRPDGLGDAPTIRAACADSARSGDLILLAPGRYTWSGQGGGDENYGMILLPRDVPGFTLRGEAGAGATIIDAERQGRVFFIIGITPGSTDNVTIEDVTITGGDAEASLLGEGCGGGAIGHLSSPTFRRCLFLENRALGGGGFCFGGWGEPTLEDCRFVGNEAVEQGGAVLLANSEPRHAMIRCEMLDNHAGVAGGAVRAYQVAFLMRDCLLAGNTAGEKGGALSLTFPHPSEVTGCTFVDNGALSGGGIRLLEAYGTGNLVVTRTIVALSRGGGAFSLEQASLQLGCSAVYGNLGGDALPPVVVDLGGNVFAALRFCDPAGGDYRLRGDSPCLPGNPPTTCDLIGARGQGCP